MKKKKILIITAFIILFTLLLGIMLGLIGYYLSDSDVNSEIDKRMFLGAKGDASTSFYAIDKSSGELSLIWQDSSYGIRDWCNINEFGQTLITAFMAAEDRDFYSHCGINIKRTFAAFCNYVFHFSNRFGASTITQQVIKNISGNSEPTIKRKIAEIYRALALENAFSKDEILEMYLNIIPLSNNIYGVGSAARLYFGKTPSELKISEAATLAAITNSPTRYNPVKNKGKCIEKRNKVLYAMLDYGCISKEEYDTAVSEDLIVNTDWETVGVNSWFVETAASDVISDIMVKYNVKEGAARTMLRGADIILTVDVKVQNLLEDFFENEINLPEEASQHLEYSFAVIDNKTGDYIGLIGRAGKKEGNRLLNLLDIPVTPASTLKPLAIYAPLIEEKMANPATLFNDIPVYYNDTDQGVVGYPKNSPDVYCGDITLADAIAFSKNTVAIEAYGLIGQDRVVEYITERFGLTSLGSNDLYPSPLALGQLSNGVSLRKLCSAYSVFPNDGVLKKARTYIGAFAKDKTVLIENNSSEQQIISKSTARVMTSLLEGVVDYGTARNVTLKNIIDIAGKTGTSGGDKDRLFVGYTPLYTAAIWCGYTDKREIGHIHPSHTSLWDDVMKQIHLLSTLRDDAAPHFTRDELIRLAFSVDDGRILSGAELSNKEDYRIAYFSIECLPPSFVKKWGFEYAEQII